MRVIIIWLMILTNTVAITAGKPIPAVMNKAFYLKIGQTTTIKNENLKISFVEMLEDSRCPQDVDCIQAGKGRIKIKVTKANSDEQVFELETTINTSTATYQDYEIKLVELKPYPKSTTPIKPNTYRAGLIVTKKSAGTAVSYLRLSEQK